MQVRHDVRFVWLCVSKTRKTRCRGRIRSIPLFRQFRLVYQPVHLVRFPILVPPMWTRTTDTSTIARLGTKQDHGDDCIQEIEWLMRLHVHASSFFFLVKESVYRCRKTHTKRERLGHERRKIRNRRGSRACCRFFLFFKMIRI